MNSKLEFSERRLIARLFYSYTKLEGAMDTTSPLNDLSKPLLYRLMDELGKLRHLPPAGIWTNGLRHVVELGGDLKKDEDRDWYINRHLDFLEERGYVRIRDKPYITIYRQIALTADGQVFVQPALAEFGLPSIFPEVVKALEDKILTYPEEEKAGTLYALRDAIAQRAPDLVAALIVEIAKRTL